MSPPLNWRNLGLAPSAYPGYQQSTWLSVALKELLNLGSFQEKAPLKPIHYSLCTLPVTPPANQAPISAPIPEVVADSHERVDLSIVDRGWYVVQFEDTAGKVKMNYVCQNVGEDGEDVVINSYLKVTSSKNSCRQEGRLFKKYPDEERALRSQFLAQLPTPEYKASGRVLFDDCVGFFCQVEL